jgi:hypothetical protein
MSCNRTVAKRARRSRGLPSSSEDDNLLPAAESQPHPQAATTISASASLSSITEPKNRRQQFMERYKTNTTLDVDVLSKLIIPIILAPSILTLLLLRCSD